MASKQLYYINLIESLTCFEKMVENEYYISVYFHGDKWNKGNEAVYSLISTDELTEFKFLEPLLFDKDNYALLSNLKFDKLYHLNPIGHQYMLVRKRTGKYEFYEMVIGQ